ncbi:MAG: SGNH/GDSL hydrolase family protein [Bacteroidales bacterium]|nr:SGNH/GDSL hydrolase family protein [Bacteroidales bacterium]
MRSKLHTILAFLSPLILFVILVFLLGIPERIIFTESYNIGFYELISLLLIVILVPAFMYKLIMVKGLRLRFYIFAVMVFFLFLVIFVKTITFSDKYHYFDPFLQMPPVLKNEIFCKKDTNEIRILALGGSTTACKELSYNLKYPTVLEKKLQEHFPEKKITVFNAGQDWFTTRHSLITYTNYYYLYDADLVLIMHAINDVYRSFTPLSYSKPIFSYDYSHFFGASSHAALPYKSYIHKLITDTDRFLNTVLLRKKDKEVDFDIEKYRSLISFTYFYQALISAIIDRNSIPIVISQPFLYKDVMSEDEIKSLWMSGEFCYNQNENNFKPYARKRASVHSLKMAMETFNAKAKELAVLNNVPYIALEKGIEKDMSNFSDDVHYTEKGADEVAEIICNFVRINNLIK